MTVWRRRRRVLRWSARMCPLSKYCLLYPSWVRGSGLAWAAGVRIFHACTPPGCGVFGISGATMDAPLGPHSFGARANRIGRGGDDRMFFYSPIPSIHPEIGNKHCLRRGHKPRASHE